jgi:predicted ferric reductase
VILVEVRNGARGTGSSPPTRRRGFAPTPLAASIVYLGLTLVPLFVILAGSGVRDRGFWVEFGVALGFIGLAMLCIQSVLTARFPRLSGAIGQDTMLQFHRQAGIVAFGFVLAHPVVLIAADSQYWEFLDPRVHFLRAIFLIAVLVALPLLIVTSLWRETFRLPYEWWRLGHGALAALVLVIGLFHIMRVQTYLSDPWKQALWLALGTASIGSIIYVRAIKPMRVKRLPYRVASVEPVGDRIWSVVVEPEAGSALEFDAGQFAFLTIDDNPFSLEQHPFSVASSAHRRDHLEFAVKELGDYTDTIGQVPAGQTAYVDGPYGAMHLPDRDVGLMLVAGGIGISPILSMLRTLRDERHTAPVVLVYAADRKEELAYDAEIAEIAKELDLEVVRVLAHPPADWDGHAGFVTDDLIGRHLPPGATEGWHFVTCGPPPMMEVAEQSLLDRGVPLRRIHSERFDIGAAEAVGRRDVQVRRLVIALGTVMVAAAVAFAL